MHSFFRLINSGSLSVPLGHNLGYRVSTVEPPAQAPDSRQGSGEAAVPTVVPEASAGQNGFGPVSHEVL